MNLNVVENEFHFIMQCSVYDNFRSVLYDNAQRETDNFNSHNENERFLIILQNFHKYLSYDISEAYKKRQHTLNVIC